MVYHVLDGANGRLQLFRKGGDFLALRSVLLEGQRRHAIRLLGWCLMSNHWHFVVWPRREGELSRPLRALVPLAAKNQGVARG